MADLTRDPFALTFDQQVEALEFVNKLVTGCYGHGKRWMNRAYHLGGQIVGLPFPVAKQAFEDCARIPARDVAADLHGMIRAALPCGWVYFARDGLTGHYKIGFSHTPKARVRALSFETRRPLEIIHVSRGFMLHEHYWHSKFMKDRIASEWFKRDSDSIAAFLERQKARALEVQK